MKRGRACNLADTPPARAFLFKKGNHEFLNAINLQLRQYLESADH